MASSYPMPQTKSLRDDFTVTEAINFSADFLEDIAEWAVKVDLRADEERTNLQTLLYANRMYFIKALQIIEKEKKSLNSL